jgi:hypothetical protein
MDEIGPHRATPLYHQFMIGTAAWQDHDLNRLFPEIQWFQKWTKLYFVDSGGVPLAILKHCCYVPCDIGGYGSPTGVGGMAANLERFRLRQCRDLI